MNRRFTYDCVIMKEEDAWCVSFPQIPEAYTDGRTREEAIANAAEVLKLVMGGYIEDGETPPEYERLAEVVSVSIEVSDEDIDKMHYETQSQAAESLGVTLSRISALIDSGRLDSKTFDGRRMVSIASVERYAASPRSAGRPAKMG